MGYFIYNVLNSDAIGLRVNGVETYNIPSRNLTMNNIPGRQGEQITAFGDLNNVQVVYSCTLFADENDADDVGINNKLNLLAQILHGDYTYRKLKDCWHPDTFRLGVVNSDVSVSALQSNGNNPHRCANIKIKFECLPQRFADSGDAFIAVNSGDVIANPMTFISGMRGIQSNPVLEITGKGTVTIQEQGDGYTAQSIVVDSTCKSDVVIVDTETMDAYSASGANLNNYVTLPLKTISIMSAAKITYTGVTSLKVKPRWWTL